MVGTLEKNKAMYALVRTPEKDIYQVRAGNYMGSDFGVIVGISDTEIKLRELVQDGAGDWTERTSSLQLQQPQDTNVQGRRR
jgi:type IV pilus assembly protein PilP